MTPHVPPIGPTQASLHDRTRTPEPRLLAAVTGRRWRSAELFGAERAIEIEHGAAVYRLRLTSLGKLILTK